MAGGDYFYHGSYWQMPMQPVWVTITSWRFRLATSSTKALSTGRAPGGDAAGGHAHHHTGASLGVFTQGDRSPGLITDSLSSANDFMLLTIPFQWD